ncbi:MAG: hypothetical protein IJN04_03200 [Clostridia bacterium]|nr:hypothetical protein [Clostridia bacterium]
MKMRKLIAILAAVLMLCSLLPLSALSVAAADTYLGCETTGSEQWNITSDYVYCPFTPSASLINEVKAYLRVRAGECTVTVGIYTGVYGQGELLAEATQSFNYGGSTNVWATFAFDAPVEVIPGQTYYVRLGSDGDPKVTLFGYETDETDENRAYVDAGRAGSGWRTNYLPNFVVVEAQTYLGCETAGSEQWNITNDYVYAAFTPSADAIKEIQAYLRVRAGECTVTASIYTDVYGAGELLAEASQSFNYGGSTNVWATFTFDAPVTVNPGQTYYVRLGSEGSPKVTMYGYATDSTDEYRAYVDDGRSGSGWRTDYLPNFVVKQMETYLGCTELGAENWNIQNDYLWAPFATSASYVDSVKAYVRVQPGVGTLTAAICTDYFGKGEVLGTATLSYDIDTRIKDWQTLTFDLPVAVNPGQVYYVRLGSDDVKVTLWGKDSATANDPWAEFVDVDRAGTGWSNNRLVNMEIVETALNDVVSCDGKSVSEDVNGLAFKFTLNADNIAVKNGNHIVLDDATAAPFTNGSDYVLTKVGAIISNDSASDMTLDNLSGRTKDIPVQYLTDLDANSASFAIRIINIPDENKDTTIYARPYYVLSNGENSIVIYDDAVSGTYNSALG